MTVPVNPKAMSVPLLNIGRLPVASFSAILEEWSGVLFVVLVVLLVYQQWRLKQLRERAAKREELFRIVAENAADMIALVDVKGRRLYNSPAYEKVLGYSAEELANTTAFEQIHPDDRYKILEASRVAKETGTGQKIDYRIKHKDGSWRILESAASTILDKNGDVEKLVIVNRDVTDRKRAEELAEHNSFHDALTGLPNRRLLLDRLQRCFVRAKRNPGFLYAVLVIDVDGFKVFNKIIGPTAGDQIIMEIGGRLASSLRHHDTVARPGQKVSGNEALLSRLGGDEFTVMLEGIRDPSDALRVAQRIHAAISTPFSVEGESVSASVSIGIALTMPELDRAEDLLQYAEVAMRRAKSLGGSRCEVYDEAMHTRAVNRLKLEAELRSAIDRSQFELCYQPILHLPTRQLLGMEALVRWHHPEQGVVSPARFFEVAESAGFMVPIGKWVLQQASQQLRTWQKSQPTLAMTVNISAKQFAHPSFMDDLKAALQESGVEPANLQLELSETDAMTDPKLTAELCAQLRQRGVRISIGDFGTGQSSLSCLRRLPLDELKIDRSLVAQMSSDRNVADIVKLIIVLARELKVRVVAEGIETAEHLQRLTQLGCEYGQGYYFSKPMDAAQGEQWLKQYSQRKSAASGRF